MPKLLTEREVSELMRCSLSRLRQDRTKKGKRELPYIKDGRSVRYDETDILTFIASRKVEIRPIEKRAQKI